MTKNPFINALAASAYIALIDLFVMSVPDKEPILAAAGPIVFLSLFVFSAAVMGYLFVLQPVLLAIAGKPKEGVTLFLQTLGCFALITLCVVVGFALLL